MIVSLLAVPVLVVAGCSSSSTTGGSGSPAAPSTGSAARSTTPVPVTTPSTADTPTPLTLPYPTSTAVDRKVTRPAGTSALPDSACSDGDDTVALFLKVSVFQAANDELQKINFTDSASLAKMEMAKIRSARAAFRAAGYPADYVLLQDMAKETAALDDLLGAIKKDDLGALPKIFLDLSTAGDQYARDSGPACG